MGSKLPLAFKELLFYNNLGKSRGSYDSCLCFKEHLIRSSFYRPSSVVNCLFHKEPNHAKPQSHRLPTPPP